MKVVQLRRREAEVKEEDIARFRNAFVNLALPVLSFAQPMPAEAFSVGDDTFTAWDTLEAPVDIRSLTVSALSEFLHESFGVYLQSVSLGDMLLYADFTDANGDKLGLPLADLVAMGGADLEEEMEDDRAVARSFLPQVPDHGFVDLDLTCVDEEGEDVRLPPLRISCRHNEDEEDENGQSKRGRSTSSRLKSLFAGAKRTASSFMSKKVKSTSAK